LIGEVPAEQTMVKCDTAYVRAVDRAAQCVGMILLYRTARQHQRAITPASGEFDGKNWKKNFKWLQFEGNSVL